MNYKLKPVRRYNAKSTALIYVDVEAVASHLQQIWDINFRTFVHDVSIDSLVIKQRYYQPERKWSRSLACFLERESIFCQKKEKKNEAGARI